MFGVVFSFVGCIFVTQKQRLAEAKARSEYGFVLVFMCISITTLTAIGGMAVDLGSWYWNADRLQRAADAASLAGSPYLPGNPAAAYAAATEVLKENGIQATNISTTSKLTTANSYTPIAYIGSDSTSTNRLQVQVGERVHNYLVSLIGVKDPWIMREGNSQFRQAVDMGSPGNVLGSEALQPGQISVQNEATLDSVAAYNSSYWLNISGGQTSKGTGDRYAAGKCDNGNDGCSNGTNTDVGTGSQGARAHEYIVHIPKNVASDAHPVVLQAFDAPFVDVGDHCDGAGTYGTQLTNATDAAKLKALATHDGEDPNLYAGGTGQYCTGDYHQGYDASGFTTTYKVQAANNNDDPTGPVLKSKTYQPLTYSASTDLASYLQSHDELRSEFRKWSDVTSFTQAGDYIVTITTPDSAGGANRFSLRVGVQSGSSWDNSVTSTKSLSVYAKYDLAVYTNAKSSDTAFYFAKLTDSAAGRNLTVELFDIGDVPSGGSVDLQMVPPKGATGISQQLGFQNCAQQGPGLYTRSDLPNCTIQGAVSSGGVTGGYNGKNVLLHIQVPNSYSCEDDGTSKCWMSLRFVLNGTAATTGSTDTTTWQIDDCGSPLKLVKSDAPDDQTCPA